MSDGRRAAKLGGIVLGGVATCVFGYLAVRGVDLDRFRRGLAESNYAWLLPAVGALAAAVWLRALRWQLLFEPETRPPLPAVTTAMLIGYLFNQLLPVRAGEAARVVALRRETGTSLAEAAGTTVTERIYDVLLLLVLLFVATPFLPAVAWIWRAAVLAIVLTLLLVALIVVVLRYGVQPVAFLFRPLGRVPGLSPARADAAAANLVHGLAALHRPRLALPALFVTVISWLVVAVSFWCVLIAFHLGVGYGASLLAVITGNLVLVVPSAPAAIGTFEAAIVLALDAFGVGRSDALAAAVVLHSLNLFPFLVAGLLALSRHSASVRQRTRTPATGAG